MNEWQKKKLHPSNHWSHEINHEWKSRGRNPPKNHSNDRHSDDRHSDDDQIDARKNDDDRLDRNDRGGSDDNDSRNGAHRDDASDIVDANKFTPTPITMHDCVRLLNELENDRVARLQDQTRIEAITDSLGPADVDYILGVIDDY